MKYIPGFLSRLQSLRNHCPAETRASRYATNEGGAEAGLPVEWQGPDWGIGAWTVAMETDAKLTSWERGGLQTAWGVDRGPGTWHSLHSPAKSKVMYRPAPTAISPGQWQPCLRSKSSRTSRTKYRAARRSFRKYRPREGHAENRAKARSAENWARTKKSKEGVRLPNAKTPSRAAFILFGSYGNACYAGKKQP